MRRSLIRRLEKLERLAKQRFEKSADERTPISVIPATTEQIRAYAETKTVNLTRR